MYNPPYPRAPRTAPVPPPPPPPEEAEEVPVAPRYPYLVNRLRNRQITMEEATELFAIQRQQVRSLLARTNALTAAAAGPTTVVATPRSAPTPQMPGMAVSIENLDPWGEGLLFLALGAGLFAALAKRMQGPAPGTAPQESSAAPERRRP
jgi:hypothetical protein